MLLVLLGETNKVSMWQKSAGTALVKARCCVLRLVESAQETTNQKLRSRNLKGSNFVSGEDFCI